MTELINKQDVLNILDDDYLIPETKRKRIEEKLAVTEIVLCKDCKHLYNDADTGKACEFTNMGMQPDDFCSYGERSKE